MARAKSTIVLVDDVSEWLGVLETAIRSNPEAASVRVARFTTDYEATRFVEQRADEIIGFIQDLHRDPSGELGGLSEGVRFLEEVISRLTPWARTIIVSAYADIRTLRHLFTVAKYHIDFISKLDFDTDTFSKALLWLLEGRFVETVAKSPASDASAAALIETLDLPWNEVCRYLAQHPEFLHTMSPAMFEELVAEIFRSYGWEVGLTARTRDGGYDIIAVRRGVPTDVRILAEAKRFAPDRTVGVEVVRSLYGVKSLNAASQVVLATSSYVSGTAKKEFSRVVPWELDFMERDRILAWCVRHGGVSLSGGLVATGLDV